MTLFQETPDGALAQSGEEVIYTTNLLYSEKAIGWQIRPDSVASLDHVPGLLTSRKSFSQDRGANSS